MSKTIKFSEEFINTFDGTYQELESIVTTLATMVNDGTLLANTTSITFGGEFDQVIEIKL
jgi:hypothetical protein